MNSNQKIGCIEWRHRCRDCYQDDTPSGAVVAWVFCCILSAGSFAVGYLAHLWGWL